MLSLYLQHLPLTHALKGFFFSVQTCGLVDVNQPLPWVLCVDLEKILSQFLKHLEEENVGI